MKNRTEKNQKKLATLYAKAENYIRIYGFEHPKTIKAWNTYDKLSRKLGAA